jgi:hypothetical protein
MPTWSVKGAYVEACNCEAVCPCIVFSPPTDGECTAILGWHVETGDHDGTRLDGLNVAMLAHADGNMKDGNWKVALYVDERADDKQQEALQGIFSGAAGGHLANLGPLIGEVLGVRPARIGFERDGSGKRFKLTVDGVGSTEIEAIAGQGNGPVQISGQPLAPVPGVAFTVARSQHLQLSDHGLRCEVSNKNGFYTTFAYQA